MKGSPLGVSDFAREVAQRFTSEAPETFWDCQEALQALVSTPAVGEALLSELRTLAADPYYLGPWLPNEWVLHRGMGTTLSIATFDSPRRYIHALPYYGMVAPLGATPLRYDRYRLPDNFRNDIFDPTLRLQADGSGEVAPGELLCLRTATHAYDFKLTTPTPVLKFLTTAVRPLEWLFSKESLQPFQANDADITFTQLRVAADVLGKFAHQSSEEPLKKLARHPHHAVRWAAIQNLGRLNRSAAVALLREAVDDPHPHVRRAAQKSLERLGPKN